MAESIISAELHEIFQGLQYTFNGNYSHAAALTFLVYNTLLTFEKEVRHIWSAAWSLSKALYIFVRYYGFFFLVSTLVVNTMENVPVKFCRGYLWYWEMSGAFVILTAVNSICALRIYAFYSRDKRMLAFLILCCLGEFASEFYGTFLIARQTSKSIIAAPLGIPFPGCLTVDRYTKIGLAAWIPSVTMAFIFFLLTSAKLRKVLEDDQGRWRFSKLRERNTISPLLLSFGRGGIIYFFLIFSVLLVSTMLSIIGKGVHFPIIYPWLITTYAIAGSNLVLSLRAANERGHMFYSPPLNVLQPGSAESSFDA